MDPRRSHALWLKFRTRPRPGRVACVGSESARSTDQPLRKRAASVRSSMPSTMAQARMFMVRPLNVSCRPRGFPLVETGLPDRCMRRRWTAAVACARTRSGSRPASAHTSSNCSLGSVSHSMASARSSGAVPGSVASKTARMMTARQSRRSCSMSYCASITRALHIAHALELACALSGTVTTPSAASCCGPRTAACRHGAESCGPPCQRYGRSRRHIRGSSAGPGTPWTRAANESRNHAGALTVDWHPHGVSDRVRDQVGICNGHPMEFCDRRRICEGRGMAWLDQPRTHGFEAFTVKRVIA